MHSQKINQCGDLYPSKSDLLEDIENQQMHLLVDKTRILSAVVLNESQAEEYQKGNWLWKDGKIAVVHRLCVYPDFHSRGIGRKTMLLAETFLAENEYATVGLDAFTQNP